MSETIAIIATCDTKGEEALYIKEKIVTYGVQPLVIDTGILGEPVKVTPDISKHKVAQMAGTTIDELISRGSRGAAVEGMQEGIYNLVKKLYSEGKIQGLLAIGGAEGAVIAAAAMAALPIGVPKLTVSPIASGNHLFKELIGYNDAMVMHSVIDILGINSISKKVFDNAVAAMVGMVKAIKNDAEITIGSVKRIAISMLGTTTKPIMQIIKPALERRGYEVVIFHANGTGGDCMEQLIKEGYFNGVIDFTTNELVGILFWGLHKSKNDRMEAAMELGLPTVVVPGAASLLVVQKDNFPDKFRGRKIYKHNPEITLIRLDAEEMRLVARLFADKLNKSRGNVKFIYPQRGFASQDKKGLALWEPEGNKAFLQELKSNLRDDIEIIEVDAHINDPEFATVVLEQFLSLLEKR